jgi:hypothetical protein
MEEMMLAQKIIFRIGTEGAERAITDLLILRDRVGAICGMYRTNELDRQLVSIGEEYQA